MSGELTLIISNGMDDTVKKGQRSRIAHRINSYRAQPRNCPLEGEGMLLTKNRLSSELREKVHLNLGGLSGEKDIGSTTGDDSPADGPSQLDV